MQSDVVDRVAVVTGAGNGLGRAHALALAAAGYAVVVNDLGGSRDGSGTSTGSAQEVVDTIVTAGGRAVANTGDISTWAGAKSLIDQAVDSFGGIDVLVNNAGILRDRMLPAMSEDEWDAVIRVHLKGTFGPTRHAAEFWRSRAKSGATNDARVINTTSPSGLFGSPGQTNYGAAKAGIAGFTVIAAMELQRYGVTVNAVAPTALTRLTEDLPAAQELAEKVDLAPEGVSPVVLWLAGPAGRDVTGRVLAVIGGTIAVVEGWAYGPEVHSDERWTLQRLDEVLPELLAKAAPNADMTGHRPVR
ncbi:SDR family oxidoreductase [Mycolicibacterium elephantis]|uniref:SDR family oxidoreductase n=1 Tax=Mycolicibacterium elephantis TaxID=81858 RepID=UPI0007EB9BE1|nr:SDR family oxidoreductase [Mycolicibacterium elephantis]OBB16329.1 short-chain dehydrogenase [Mycolicibacterium elephantis]OBE95273.1 short-chain dehydrogenase [Mycolicibacterium elephantis]